MVPDVQHPTERDRHAEHRREFNLEHVVPYIAARIERLRPHFVHPIKKRVALHEHPGLAGVTEGAIKILTAIPGLELVDLEQPRVGYMCNSLAPVPAYKRELHARELDAAAAAGVDYLVGIYHACHRELCAHETTSPFKIVNFLELVGEAMGVEKTDLFKQWKMMQDVDRVLAEVAGPAQAAGLDLESVREVLVPTCWASNPCRWIIAACRRSRLRIRRFGLSRSRNERRSVHWVKSLLWVRFCCSTMACAGIPSRTRVSY